MKFSILTATYNRAKYLNKLYESIQENVSSDYEIEWLIMNDGSQDNTEEICNKFFDDSSIHVKYFKQENQGKMQAINNLIKYVSGDFIVECDSDDYFVKNALKIISEKSIILQENKNLYALVFLKNENPKTLSGSKFPFEDEDTRMFDLYFKFGITGEKIIVYKSEIRKKYKYILEDGENFCTEARMQHKIDLDYNVRCYNQVVVEGEYQSDGYTKNINDIFFRNPKGHYEYFKEILKLDMSGVKFDKRLYAIKHYILFAILTKNKNNIKSINNMCNKLIYIILYIPGKIKTKKWSRNNIFNKERIYNNGKRK